MAGVGLSATVSDGVGNGFSWDEDDLRIGPQLDRLDYRKI